MSIKVKEILSVSKLRRHVTGGMYYEYIDDIDEEIRKKREQSIEDLNEWKDAENIGKIISLEQKKIEDLKNNQFGWKTVIFYEVPDQ